MPATTTTTPRWRRCWRAGASGRSSLACRRSTRPTSRRRSVQPMRIDLGEELAALLAGYARSTVQQRVGRWTRSSRERPMWQGLKLQCAHSASMEGTFGSAGQWTTRIGTRWTATRSAARWVERRTFSWRVACCRSFVAVGEAVLQRASGSHSEGRQSSGEQPLTMPVIGGLELDGRCGPHRRHSLLT